MDDLYDTANQLPYTQPMLEAAANQFGIEITNIAFA
jgi:hypothetical protein